MKRSASARLVFGRNLRQRRTNFGLSQEAFAEIVQIHRTYVGAVERGERNVSIDNTERFAKALKTTIAKLLQD